MPKSCVELEPQHLGRVLPCLSAPGQPAVLVEQDEQLAFQPSLRQPQLRRVAFVEAAVPRRRLHLHGRESRAGHAEPHDDRADNNGRLLAAPLLRLPVHAALEHEVEEEGVGLRYGVDGEALRASDGVARGDEAIPPRHRLAWRQTLSEGLVQLEAHGESAGQTAPVGFQGAGVDGETQVGPPGCARSVHEMEAAPLLHGALAPRRHFAIGRAPPAAAEPQHEVQLVAVGALVEI